MKSRKNKTTVVDDVRAQTDQAAALAAISGQERLADPRLNPATRGHADQLRDAQQIQALNAADARLRRRYRVEDRCAAEAEETLDAIALARQATSPARSVRALSIGKKHFTRVSLTASIVLAVGSAMGVEASAAMLGAPTGSGYLAEIGLTGLATFAITYRSHLAEHRGKLVRKTWQSRVLWALMIVPLLVSVACNLVSLNVIGAFCSIFAAGFALAACVVADRSAAAMQDRVAEVSVEDEDRLRRIAMGGDLFAPVAVEPDQNAEQDTGHGPTGSRESFEVPQSQPRRPDEREYERDRARTRTRRSTDPQEAPQGALNGDLGDAQRATHLGDAPSTSESSQVPQERLETEPGGGAAEEADEMSVEADQMIDELAAYLARQEPPETGAAAPVPPAPGGGPAGTARGLPGRRDPRRLDPGHTVAAVGAADPGHTDADQGTTREGAVSVRPGSHRAEQPGAERVQAATNARREVGERNRQRVAAYDRDHPKASHAQAGRALNLSPETVKRHRRELKRIARKGEK